MRYLRFSLLVLGLAVPVAAGTLAVGGGIADIPVGTPITVTAAPAPEGMVFDRWTGDTANLADPFSSTTVLTMPTGSVALTATYKTEPAPPPPPEPPPPEPPPSEPPTPPADPVLVRALVETAGVGDPDDMWLWENPVSRGDSILYAADKSKKEIVWFNLAGTKLGSLPEPGRPNNIDGRGNFLAVSLRNADQIGLYTVDPGTGLVTKRGVIKLKSEPYGFCLYESPTTLKTYAYVSGRKHDIQQWELDLTSWTGTLVRTISTPKVEGMAAHDKSARFFYAQEDASLCVIGAEPTDPTTHTEIANVADTNLTDDLEGVATVGDLYLLVSVQGASEFAVYDLQAPTYRWLGNFKIKRLDGDIDSVTSTDGIAWHGGSFNATFPAGIFFAHDSRNSGGRNIKMVPWEQIAAALGLQTP